MGNFTGSISFRDIQNASGAGIAAAHNNLHAAIIGCGMTQVASGDFAGQAGTFVAGTAGAGQTSVPEMTNGDIENQVHGYKLYKHPTLSLYVLVSFEAYKAGWASRFARYVFKFGLELSGGVLTAAKLSPAIYPFLNIYGSSTESAVGTAAVSLFANCGPDNFWLHAPGAFPIQQTSGNYTPPDQGSMLSIGVFESGGSYGAVSTLEYVGQGANNYGPSLTGSAGPQGSRYWQSDGSSWVQAQNCSFGSLADPATVTVGGATRAARANKIIGGVRRYFRFGFVSRQTANEGDILSLDLDGSGVKNYRACNALGPSSPMFYSQTTAQYSVPVLPWGN